MSSQQLALQQAAQNSVARTASRDLNVKTYIQTCHTELQRALPKGMSADRVARIALTAVTKTPKLADCTPQSFAGALLTAAALGLEPNTPTCEAYLIPYKQDCQLIIGYQGMVKLFYQHPMAVSIDAQPVWEADDFDYRYGGDQYLSHKPNLARREGKPYCFWAQAKLANGGTPFEVMTQGEINMIRAASIEAKRRSGVKEIPDPQYWMERKTVIRQLMKRLPKSVVSVWSNVADEQAGSDLYRQIPEMVASLPAVDMETGLMEGDCIA